MQHQAAADQPRAAAATGTGRGRGSRAGTAPECPDPGPSVLPRHRPVGGRRPGPLGAWAAPCPISAARRCRTQDQAPPQVPDGPADPRTAPGPARPGRRGRRGAAARPRTAQAAAARHRDAGRRRSPPPARPCAGRCTTRPPARRSGPRTPTTGKRRNLTRRGRRRVLGLGRPSKCCAAPASAIEELLELTHHSIVQYRLPTTGELVPLLQIAPSKTDAERLLSID